MTSLMAMGTPPSGQVHVGGVGLAAGVFEVVGKITGDGRIHGLDARGQGVERLARRDLAAAQEGLEARDGLEGEFLVHGAMMGKGPQLRGFARMERGEGGMGCVLYSVILSGASPRAQSKDLRVGTAVPCRVSTAKGRGALKYVRCGDKGRGGTPRQGPSTALADSLRSG